MAPTPPPDVGPDDDLLQAHLQEMYAQNRAKSPQALLQEAQTRAQQAGVDHVEAAKLASMWGVTHGLSDEVSDLFGGNDRERLKLARAAYPGLFETAAYVGTAAAGGALRGGLAGLGAARSARLKSLAPPATASTTIMGNQWNLDRAAMLARAKDAEKKWGKFNIEDPRTRAMVIDAGHGAAWGLGGTDLEREDKLSAPVAERIALGTALSPVLATGAVRGLQATLNSPIGFGGRRMFSPREFEAPDRVVPSPIGNFVAKMRGKPPTEAYEGDPAAIVQRARAMDAARARTNAAFAGAPQPLHVDTAQPMESTMPAMQRLADITANANEPEFRPQIEARRQGLVDNVRDDRANAILQAHGPAPGPPDPQSEQIVDHLMRAYDAGDDTVAQNAAHVVAGMKNQDPFLAHRVRAAIADRVAHAERTNPALNDQPHVQEWMHAFEMGDHPQIAAAQSQAQAAAAAAQQANAQAQATYQAQLAAAQAKANNTRPARQSQAFYRAQVQNQPIRYAQELADHQAQEAAAQAAHQARLQQLKSLRQTVFGKDGAEYLHEQATPDEVAHAVAALRSMSPGQLDSAVNRWTGGMGGSDPQTNTLLLTHMIDDVRRRANLRAGLAEDTPLPAAVRPRPPKPTAPPQPPVPPTPPPPAVIPARKMPPAPVLAQVPAVPAPPAPTLTLGRARAQFPDDPAAINARMEPADLSMEERMNDAAAAAKQLKRPKYRERNDKALYRDYDYPLRPELATPIAEAMDASHRSRLAGNVMYDAPGSAPPLVLRGSTTPTRMNFVQAITGGKNHGINDAEATLAGVLSGPLAYGAETGVHMLIPGGLAGPTLPQKKESPPRPMRASLADMIGTPDKPTIEGKATMVKQTPLAEAIAEPLPRPARPAAPPVKIADAIARIAADASTNELVNAAKAAGPIVQNASVTQDPVRQAQTIMEKQGIETGKIDGRYGPVTESAVRALQGAMGYPQDGKLTERTMKALVMLDSGALKVQYPQVYKEFKTAVDQMQADRKELAIRRKAAGK